jgi:hypothetical protein
MKGKDVSEALVYVLNEFARLEVFRKFILANVRVGKKRSFILSWLNYFLDKINQRKIVMIVNNDEVWFNVYRERYSGRVRSRLDKGIKEKVVGNEDR